MLARQPVGDLYAVISTEPQTQRGFASKSRGHQRVVVLVDVEQLAIRPGDRCLDLVVCALCFGEADGVLDRTLNARQGRGQRADSAAGKFEDFCGRADPNARAGLVQQLAERRDGGPDGGGARCSDLGVRLATDSVDEQERGRLS